MSFITTVNFVTYILTALSVAAFGLYGWLYFTGGFKPAKLVKSIIITNAANLLFTFATIALCFVDFRATCTFMFWSTIVTAPLGWAIWVYTKKYIADLLAQHEQQNVVIDSEVVSPSDAAYMKSHNLV